MTGKRLDAFRFETMTNCKSLAASNGSKGADTGRESKLVVMLGMSQQFIAVLLAACQEMICTVQVAFVVLA